MKTLSQVNSNLDRFENEGGALPGRAELRTQDKTQDNSATRETQQAGSWRVRAAFCAELEAVLDAKDELDSRSARLQNRESDGDEEFAQRFQELIDEQLLPQFESAAAILAKRYYPAEVKVIGKPGERICFFAFSPEKTPGVWARNGANITGPRMIFTAHMKRRCVLYKANFRHGVSGPVQRVMQVSEITDSFIEQELRHFFDSAVAPQCSSSANLCSDGSLFLKLVGRTCA